MCGKTTFTVNNLMVRHDIPLLFLMTSFFPWPGFLEMLLKPTLAVTLRDNL